MTGKNTQMLYTEVVRHKLAYLGQHFRCLYFCYSWWHIRAVDLMVSAGRIKSYPGKFP